MKSEAWTLCLCSFCWLPTLTPRPSSSSSSSSFSQCTFAQLYITLLTRHVWKTVLSNRGPKCGCTSDCLQSRINPTATHITTLQYSCLNQNTLTNLCSWCDWWYRVKEAIKGWSLFAVLSSAIDKHWLGVGGETQQDGCATASLKRFFQL